MKLKDLLANREKLAQYDELKVWKENFSNMVEVPITVVPRRCIVGLQLPDHIKQTIISALEAEIAKLDEELSVDIKSLRIGSHILVNGKRVRVFGIGNNAIFYLPSIVSSVCKEAKIEQIEPIAITPELLKELGFEYHEYDNGNLWEWRFDDLYKAYGYLEFDEDTTTLWRGRLWHMKEIETEFRVEYLHELENLFYMFYEKELIPD